MFYFDTSNGLIVRKTIPGCRFRQYPYGSDFCNRLTEITDGIRQVKHYTYDNSGNMLSDGEMSYLYDGFGRLEQVTKADGSFQKNHYDAEGLRAEMEENGQLVKFLYNEDREAVAEEKSDGNVIRYIRGLGWSALTVRRRRPIIIMYLTSREVSPMLSMVRTRKAENSHRRTYSRKYLTTMNTMHSAIPSDVKNRCTTASVIQESSTTR